MHAQVTCPDLQVAPGDLPSKGLGVLLSTRPAWVGGRAWQVRVPGRAANGRLSAYPAGSPKKYMNILLLFFMVKDFHVPYGLEP